MRPSENVVSRAIAGEQILVPVRSGAAQMDFIFTVNEVGAFIFGLLDGRRTTSEIASLVSREFEVEEIRARAEICEFLEALSQAGLVRPEAEEAL
jgi:hypothetical protein